MHLAGACGDKSQESLVSPDSLLTLSPGSAVSPTNQIIEFLRPRREEAAPGGLGVARPARPPEGTGGAQATVDPGRRCGPDEARMSLGTTSSVLFGGEKPQS